MVYTVKITRVGIFPLYSIWNIAYNYSIGTVLIFLTGAMIQYVASDLIQTYRQNINISFVVRTRVITSPTQTIMSTKLS